MKAFVMVETVIKTRERVILEIPEEIKEQYTDLIEQGQDQRAQDLVTDHVLSNRYDEAISKAPSYHHADSEESYISIVQPWQDE